MAKGLTLFLLTLGLPLWSCERPQQTMGRYIQSAQLIAIVDTAASPPFESVTITFREYLKGSSGPPRNTATIRSRPCPWVPAGKGYAILLSAGWQTSESPVVEVYTAAADLADLRTLVKVYDLRSERQRLDAVRALANEGKPRYREQIFDDLRNMHEPANYAIVMDLYPSLDKAGRLKMVDIIGYIGDTRGVPVLLDALRAADADLADSARRVLATYFPGAPGVGEALRRHASPPPHESEMQKAFRLFTAGRQKEARPRLLAVAANRRESPEIRMWAALDLVDLLDAAGKNALRTTLWPLLVRMVLEGNYLQIADAARILRALRHPDNLPLLLQLLGRKDFVGQKTPYLAAMAIRELGPGGRAKAVFRLIEMLEAESKAQGYRMVGGTPPAPLLALAWLGGDREFQRTEPIRGDYLRPVWGAGLKTDEGAFLLQGLRQPGNLPPDGIDWVVTRLGELKYRPAGRAVIQQIPQASWPVAQSAQETLIQIGGMEVESAASTLLASSAPGPAREVALRVLYGLKGAGSLPEIRGALSDRELRTTALFLLANLGTAQDLSVLVPMSDFWTGDRESHYWLMQAIAGIRSRYP